jgi:septum formation inhibitor MinC
VIEEKTAELEALLAAGSVVEIAGLVFEQTERLQLEQRLCARLGRYIEVRIGKPQRNVPNSMVHHGTVRGGMCLRCDGDIIIVGDVHVGARIEAGGHIVVLGKLHGAAWAGCGDREDAMVSAWQLSPSEIRIAGVIGQKSGMCYQEKQYPETAYASKGVICVRKYNV